MDGFAYAELYVADGPAAVAYYVDGMDFSPVAEAHLPDRYAVLLRAGDIQLVISTPHGGNSPVADWLDLHGDGVADVAMFTDDVPAAVARGILAGLPVLRRASPGRVGHMTGTVGGIGSLRHTLVAPASSRLVAPPDFPWVQIGDGGRSIRASRLMTLDHVALCLPAGTLDMTAFLYRQVFEVSLFSREVIDVDGAGMDSRVLRNASGRVTFVLAEPTSAGGGQVKEFVKAHGGAGVQHLAFSTAGITETVTAYTDNKVEFCTTPATYYEDLAARLTDLHVSQEQVADLRRTGVLLTSDHGGRLAQIFTASPHDGPMFYELIERSNGAIGFGAENVRHLFRARQAQERAAGRGSAELDVAG